jgi:hypothetical protein
LALQNSPPLSDLTAATFKLSGLKKDSDAVMKFLRSSAASDFVTKGIMLVHLVKPSTIVKKYFSPANPGTEIGPQMSTWRSCNGAVGEVVAIRGKVLVMLPEQQWVHKVASAVGE